MNSFLPSYEFLLLDHSNVSTYRESYCGDDPECFQQQQQQQQYSYQHDQDREEDIQLIDHFLVQENLSLPEEEQRSNDNQGAQLTVPPVRQRFQANARERCRTQRCGSQRFLLFLSCRGCVDVENNLEIFLCSSWLIQCELRLSSAATTHPHGAKGSAVIKNRNVATGQELHQSFGHNINNRYEKEICRNGVDYRILLNYFLQEIVR